MEMTETSDQASAAGFNSVKILSVTNAPAMDSVPVALHYFEDGIYKNRVFDSRRPVYFDEIVVSKVFETLPAFRYPIASCNSARNLARNALALAKQARASMASPVVYTEPVFDLRMMAPSNIGHMLSDIIPFALLARESAGPTLKVLLPPVGEPFTSLLRHYGLSATWEDRRVTGQIMKVSGTRGLSLYDLPTTFDCTGLHFAPDIILHSEIAPGPGFKKIFLARRAARSLRNQVAVEKITNEYGYKTLFMEDYSVEEQLSIAAHTKHVIAMHGAAMGLLLVNKQLDSVIELFPANVYHQHFSTCLGKRVHRYEQIMPEFDPRVPHRGWGAILEFKNRDFSVDVPLLERLLSEIHAPASARLSSVLEHSDL